MPKTDQRGALAAWRVPVAGAGLLLLVALDFVTATAAPEQVSFRVAPDTSEDPVRLEVLRGERVVCGYTPDGSVTLLIDAKSVLIPEYGRLGLLALWQIGVQSQLLMLIDPEPEDRGRPRLRRDAVVGAGEGAELLESFFVVLGRTPALRVGTGDGDHCRLQAVVGLGSDK